MGTHQKKNLALRAMGNMDLFGWDQAPTLNDPSGSGGALFVRRNGVLFCGGFTVVRLSNGINVL